MPCLMLYKQYLRYSQILKDGDIEFVSSQTLTGGFEDIFTGICCAPDSIIGRKDVFVAQYTVSLSNNGIHFGKEESVYVFDSSCQSISTSEAGSKTFSLKVSILLTHEIKSCYCTFTVDHMIVIFFIFNLG
jgi:hypothetical protein